jgi:hypothetical protein
MVFENLIRGDIINIIYFHYFTSLFVWELAERFLVWNLDDLMLNRGIYPFIKMWLSALLWPPRKAWWRASRVMFGFCGGPSIAVTIMLKGLVLHNRRAHRVMVWYL